MYKENQFNYFQNTQNVYKLTFSLYIHRLFLFLCNNVTTMQKFVVKNYTRIFYVKYMHVS